jgi:hypothetical protein
MDYVSRGQRLPAPRTFPELLSGVSAWMVAHWWQDDDFKPCPNCRTVNWAVGPVVSFEANERWPSIDGRYGSFPAWRMACNTCGNTMFVNLLLIFEAQQPQP